MPTPSFDTLDLPDLFDDEPTGVRLRARDPRPVRESDDWTTEREVWTVTEIASAMSAHGPSVAPSTVRGWCETAVLQAAKTSARGHWRVCASDLRLYLNGHAEPLAA